MRKMKKIIGANASLTIDVRRHPLATPHGMGSRPTPPLARF
jgi:hypothetical protein